MKKKRFKKKRVFKMAGKEELLAEPVTQFPSFDRSHHTFKDKNKKNLACDDVTKQVDYPNGKENSEKGFSFFILYTRCKYTIFLSNKKLKRI